MNRIYQKECISVERKRASADHQHKLVTEEIKKKAAAQHIEQFHLEGEGQKLKLS